MKLKHQEDCEVEEVNESSNSNRCPGKPISPLEWEALSFVQDTEQRVESQKEDLVGDTD